MTLRFTWRKSSYSSSQGDECVEPADLAGAVGIRDSKDPDGPRLAVSRDAFRAFMASEIFAHPRQPSHWLWMKSL
jgi:hypothetical protein